MSGEVAAAMYPYRATSCSSASEGRRQRDSSSCLGVFGGKTGAPDHAGDDAGGDFELGDIAADPHKIALLDAMRRDICLQHVQWRHGLDNPPEHCPDATTVTVYAASSAASIGVNNAASRRDGRRCSRS
jgi:hypothetical protein